MDRRTKENVGDVIYRTLDLLDCAELKFLRRRTLSPFVAAIGAKFCEKVSTVYQTNFSCF